MEGYHAHCPHVNTLVARKLGSPATLIIPIRCKRWSCSYCKRVNLRRLIHRVKDGKPNKLITLTCHVKPGDTPEAVYNSHRPMIRKLIAKIRSCFGSFECGVFCEQHESGFPHWHITARCHYIPQKVLSLWWQELTGSYVVDIRSIHTARQVVNYVTKYVTKTCGLSKPDWCKRVYQFTQHYAKTARRAVDPDIIFDRLREHPQAVLERLTPYYERQEDVGRGWALWSGPVEQQGWLWDFLADKTKAPG